MKDYFALLLLVGLSAMVSCNTPNRKWENDPDNDRVVHIYGTIDHLAPRDVRVCPSGTDYTHGDHYYSIQVKGGCFSADVPLNADTVYELLILWERNYHSCRFQVFFADQDTLQFVYDAHEDNYAAPDLIQNPEGSNLDYLNFRAEKNARFAEERQALQEEYRSIKDHYWSAEFERLNKLIADKNLDRYARDSVKLLLGQMYQDRTAYTPEGRAYLERQDQLERMGLDFAKHYLETRQPSLACLEIAYESIRTASEQDYDYQAWRKMYEQVYADRFENSNLHQLIDGIISATSVHEGGRFIDFTLPDKDFTVVEVAREFRNDSKWRAFIEKDGADWTDLLAMEENHSVGDAYGLREKAGSIFLIDKEGVIIKVNPAKEEIEAVLGME